MGEIKEVKEMFESANSPTPLSSAYIKTIDNVVEKTTEHY